MEIMTPNGLAVGLIPDSVLKAEQDKKTDNGDSGKKKTDNGKKSDNNEK